jgi:hypothetical protein
VNPRKERLLAKVRGAMPEFLEAGERPEVILQAVTGVHPWAIVGAVTLLAVAIVVPLGANDAFGSVWAYVLLGAVVGGLTGLALVVSSSWIVVTDRRVLRLAMSPWNQAPAGLRDATARSAVAPVGGIKRSGLGYRDVTLRRTDGTTQALRVNRLWHEEVRQLVEALSPSDSSTPPGPE